MVVGDHQMTRHTFALTFLIALIAGTALAETLSPETDACKASGLLALKQKFPQVKDVLLDADSATAIKPTTTMQNVPIKGRGSRRRLCALSATREKCCSCCPPTNNLALAQRYRVAPITQSFLQQNAV